MAARRRSMRTRALSLWLCTFVGGAVCGAGLFLLGQLQVILAIRQQVGRMGFFTRFLGRMTFLWRGLDEKLSLALADIPQEYLDHSRRVAWAMALLGFLGVAMVLPWWLRRRWRR